MFYVYLIRSLVKNWVYVGLTYDVDNRIDRHNKGLEQTTKAYRPFELIFVQIVNSRIEARNLEKFLKVKFNKESLLDIINLPGW